MKNSKSIKYSATVCIPASNRNKSLYQCLNSLETQTKKDFYVIIVFSDKKYVDFRKLKRYKLNITACVQKGPGLVSAMNLGLSKTTTKIFIRIDDDVVCAPYWFENIMKPFGNMQVAGVTGPTIVPENLLANRPSLKFITTLSSADDILLRPIKKVYFDFLYEGMALTVSSFSGGGNFSFGSNFQKSIPKFEKVVENLEACNFAVQTKLLKKISGFDPVFSNGLGEYHEADMAFKLRRQGYVLVFNPNAKVNHLVDKINTRGDSYGRMSNFLIFYKRHFVIDNFATLIRFLLNVLIQNCYHATIFLKTGKASALGSVWATISQLKGIRFN